MKFNIIVAVDQNNGIGYQNKLAWSNKRDLDFFRKLTTFSPTEKKNSVIMGKNTFLSIGKPLPNRHNIVISKTLINKDVCIVNNLTEALLMCQNSNEIFIIGGAMLYQEALRHPELEYIYITRLKEKYLCDTFFPELEGVELIKKNEYDDLIFYKYLVKNDYGERGYLNLMRKTLQGIRLQTRNAITFSIFGEKLEFDLSKGFPLLTTKKIFWKGIVEELLWFIRGQTNSKILEEKGVKIWKANTTLEFLQQRGLPYQEGDIGPMYGFQWRYYGSSYKNMNSRHEGYDQLKECLRMIIEEPNSRRILMTTFNPVQVSQSVLAPCHGIKIQFNVCNDIIDLQMDQRSVDEFLGLPFNIASYALLLELICYITHKKAGKLIMTFGNAHIYEEHLEACQNQLSRIPKQLPTLKILKNFDGTSINEMISFLENLEINDIIIKNYQHDGVIRAKMIP